MAKNPHPSGRPIRRKEEKIGRQYWNYPAETYATPRLRPKSGPIADAIGYRTIEAVPTWDAEEASRPIGFMRFK
jgi:hypothetical protein